MARTVGLGVTLIEVEGGCEVSDILAAICAGRVRIDGRKTSSDVFVGQAARWVRRRITSK